MKRSRIEAAKGHREAVSRAGASNEAFLRLVRCCAGKARPIGIGPLLASLVIMTTLNSFVTGLAATLALVGCSSAPDLGTVGDAATDGPSDHDARSSVDARSSHDAGEPSDAHASPEGQVGNNDGAGPTDAGRESDIEAGIPDAGPHAGPQAVNLGTAGDYVLLAKSAISNVPTSTITGNLGLSPAAASYITGFPLTRAGTFWTTPQVVGDVFAANNDPPTPSNLTVAIGDMQTAYTDAAGRPTPSFLNRGGGAIGGLTLAPGLYKWTSAVTVAADVVISGEPDDVWIFQISGDLTTSSATQVTLAGGARPENVFWQVAGDVDFGTTSHVEGIVLCQTLIKLETGASINGRLLAQTEITLAGNAVTAP